jgi:hypothetical protein
MANRRIPEDFRIVPKLQNDCPKPRKIESGSSGALGEQLGEDRIFGYYKFKVF